MLSLAYKESTNKLSRYKTTEMVNTEVVTTPIILQIKVKSILEELVNNSEQDNSPTQRRKKNT